MNEPYSTPPKRTPLPNGFLLHKKYRIQKVLGTGGFGITYLASFLDETENPVAIKEYFPSEISMRKKENNFDIVTHSQEDDFYFQKGYRRIIREGEIIRRFQNLNSIVKLYDLFEENRTVYLVMEYIDGITLQQYITEQGTLTYPEVLTLFSPVIRDLAGIHKEGIIHCDITPANLIISMENKLRLIDFGSFGDKKIQNKEKTVILRTGYAPPEQYLSSGKLGPWTDVYATCATICFALSGNTPSDAMQREENDFSSELEHIPELSPEIKKALAKGMMIRISDRFPDMNELYLALSGNQESEHPKTKFISGQSEIDASLFPKRRKKALTVLIPAGFLCGILLFLTMYVFPGKPADKKHATRTEASRSTADSTTVSVSPVTVSRAPETETPKPDFSPSGLLTMPDLTGMKLKKGKQLIKTLDSGIRIKVSYKSSKKRKKGTVISQSIAKNTSFTKGQIKTLLLSVSSGKKTAASAVSTPTKSPVTQKPASTPKQKKESPDRKKTNDDSFTYSTQKPYDSFTLE